MLFNFGRCKCLHTGHGNLDVNYKMGDTVLGTTVKEKDLGVTISADMKVSEKCCIAASKGNQIIGLIRRNITYKGKQLIIPLYKAIVRPHLEYCIKAWRSYRKKDVDTTTGLHTLYCRLSCELLQRLSDHACYPIFLQVTSCEECSPCLDLNVLFVCSEALSHFMFLQGSVRTSSVFR